MSTIRPASINQFRPLTVEHRHEKLASTQSEKNEEGGQGSLRYDGSPSQHKQESHSTPQSHQTTSDSFQTSSTEEAKHILKLEPEMSSILIELHEMILKQKESHEKLSRYIAAEHPEKGALLDRKSDKKLA
jgi:hypothetical protein